MIQGFESREPQAAETARRIAIAFVWIVAMAFAVTLFVQSLYESTVAAIVVGVLLFLLTIGPLVGLRRGRIGIDRPEHDEFTDVSRDLAHRG